ncbi:unnamed protein product [Brassica oleracea]
MSFPTHSHSSVSGRLYLFGGWCKYIVIRQLSGGLDLFSGWCNGVYCSILSNLS